MSLSFGENKFPMSNKNSILRSSFQNEVNNISNQSSNSNEKKEEKFRATLNNLKK